MWGGVLKKKVLAVILCLAIVFQVVQPVSLWAEAIADTSVDKVLPETRYMM